MAEVVEPGSYASSSLSKSAADICITITFTVAELMHRAHEKIGKAVPDKGGKLSKAQLISKARCETNREMYA